MAMVQFMDSLGGIQYCITIFSKCVFDINVPFHCHLISNLLSTASLIKIKK